MPVIPTLQRQRQGNLCEFKSGLAYREKVSGQPGLHTERFCLKINKQKECHAKPNKLVTNSQIL